jgi:hypothetical protein
MEIFLIKTRIENEFLVKANNKIDATKKLIDEIGERHAITSCKKFEFSKNDVYDCKTNEAD